MDRNIPLWRRLLSPPIFEGDEEKTRTGRTLFTILIVLLCVTPLAYFSLLFSFAPVRLAAISTLLLVEIIAFSLLRFGKIRLASNLLVMVAWITLVAALAVTGGVDGSSAAVQTIIVLTAGLLLGGPASLIFAALSSLAGLGMLVAEMNGTLPPSMVAITPPSYWFFLTLTFFLSAGMIYLTTNSLKEALEHARKNAAAQMIANQELQTIRASLEEQVKQRTSAMEQRSRYLLASIEVSRAAASILDTDRLIQQTVDLIQEQFQLYYAGLFLVDSEGEWAIHKAGTGPAGRALLRRGHRIRIGSGMIGWSIANAAPRIAQIASEDAQRLATAELPDTRSEAAIPLRSRGKILGAITVQSDKPDAFGEMEIISFQAMADQIALAIDNARLLEESQRAIQEVQRAYGIASRMAWKEMLQSGKRLAYRYEKGIVSSIDEIPMDREPAQSTPSQSHVVPSGTPLRIPIKVREQIIGYLGIRRAGVEKPAKKSERSINTEPENVTYQAATGIPTDDAISFSEEQVELLQGISDQLGVALDSARLYQDTQRLALREQLTSEVTSRIRSTLDMDSVLKTAAQEIQKTLEVPEVIITLKTAHKELSTNSTDVGDHSSKADNLPADTRDEA